MVPDERPILSYMRFTLSGTHIRREHGLAVLGICVEHSFLLITKRIVSLSIMPVFFFYGLCVGKDAGGSGQVGPGIDFQSSSERWGLFRVCITH